MKKKALNWSFSELFLTGHFQSFFFRSDPKSEKNSRKSTNKKKIWPKLDIGANSDFKFDQ